MTTEQKLREALNGDVVLRLVYRHFSDEAHKYLLTVKWKDGIDIDEPSHQLIGFLQDICEALSTKPQTSDEGAPTGTPLTDAPDDWFRDIATHAKAASDKLNRAGFYDEAMLVSQLLNLTKYAPQEGKKEDGWLPIKTAPKNGTLVLVSWRDHALVVAAVHAQADDYGRSWYGFVPALGLMMLRTPHFWMPLPSPPSKAETP